MDKFTFLLKNDPTFGQQKSRIISDPLSPLDGRLKILQNQILFVRPSQKLHIRTYQSSQIREQMSFPDLKVFKLRFIALKKLVFPHKKYFPKFLKLLFTFILCNFSVRTLTYFQRILNQFFVHKNFKKCGAKVAHNRPRPFYFIPAQTTSHSPVHSPQPIGHYPFFKLMKSRDQNLFTYLCQG